MRFLAQAFLATTAWSTIASALLAPIVSNVECLAVTAVVQVLAAQPQATSFCSSFLKIQTSTITTSTTTTLPPLTVVEATSTTVTQSVCRPTPVTCPPAVQKRLVVPASISVSLGVSIPTPGPLLGLVPRQISTICSCLRVPTPSTTVTQTFTTLPVVTSTTTLSTTTTITTAAACPTPPSCNNAGLQYGAFRNTQGRNSGATYPSFNPVYLKAPGGASSFLFNGSTPVPGVNGTCASTEQISVYNSATTLSCEFFTLNHRGYFYPPVTGTYTFAFSGVDDIALLWLGDKAITGWTRGNADLVATLRPGSGSFTTSLTESQYVPLRIVFGQGQRTEYGFQFSVTDPFGSVIVDSRCGAAAGGGAQFLVQFSCDGSATPFVGAFGAEP